MHHDRGTKCTPAIFSEGKNPQTHACLRACLRAFMLTRLLLRPSGFLLGERGAVWNSEVIENIRGLKCVEVGKRHVLAAVSFS